jgi:hypothetical protein
MGFLKEKSSWLWASLAGAAHWVFGALGSVSGITAWIGAAWEKTKWFLIFAIGLVVLLIVARGVGIGRAVVLAIAAVVRFLAYRRPSPEVVVEKPAGAQVRCPGCGKVSTVPAAYAGKRLRCKHCEANFSAPG